MGCQSKPTEIAEIEFRYLTNLKIGGDDWTNHRVEAWRGDEKLGHITMAFIPRRVFEARYSTIEYYVCRIKGFQDATEGLCTEYASDYRRFEEFHVETAHVAMVTVEEDHQRQGIATLLYLEGARWLAERHGLKLAASSLQSIGVPNLWKKLVADLEAPTVKLNDGRWALDGRVMDGQNQIQEGTPTQNP